MTYQEYVPVPAPQVLNENLKHRLTLAPLGLDEPAEAAKVEWWKKTHPMVLESQMHPQDVKWRKIDEKV